MNEETKIKLLAWFAVHAPEVPVQYIAPMEDGPLLRFAETCEGFKRDNMRPIMSREAWCAEWARRQLVEFEKMWETLETP